MPRCRELSVPPLTGGSGTNSIGEVTLGCDRPRIDVHVPDFVGTTNWFRGTYWNVLERIE